MSKRDWIGRGLLTLAIAATPGFQVTADWTSGHITNPDWPPHAKYHLIVYHLTLIEFSLAAIAGCWWPGRFRSAGPSVALFSVVAFWVPYYLAALFPQASPYATPELARHPVPVQFIVGAGLVVLAILGWALSRSALRLQDSSTPL
jgi:hypothetical protein